MLQHVYDKAVASAATEVVIATDDELIAEAATGFDATVAMTRADHQSGTDRIAEVAEQLGWDADAIVVSPTGNSASAANSGT